ncbi:MAG: protein kinase domain-containing protein, partial [Gemmataceae bacterium]
MSDQLRDKPTLEPTDERDPLDVLVEEFAERCRRGEQPSPSEYLTRYPHWAEELRELLPAAAMMEELSRHKRGDGAVVQREAIERLGDYRIVREIGRGGMGIVYEAVQESLGRHVALKVLPRHSLLDPKKLARFQREAQAAAALHHSNIVPVFGVGEHDGLH